MPRRYKLGFVLYWLLFAAFAVSAAKDPGFVRHPELVPFSWLGLFVIWGVLAVLVAIFYAILRPTFVKANFLRLTMALALSTVMVVASALTMVTDMPGLYYIPHYFSMLTFLILLTVFAMRVGKFLWQKLTNTCKSGHF